MKVPSRFLAIALIMPSLAVAQESDFPILDLDMRLKAAVRDSEDVSFPLQFPPGAELRTVEPGLHADFMTLELSGRVQFSPDLAAKGKLDIVDRFDRNPTSEDQEVDLDELWLRYGQELRPGEMPEGSQAYVKAGKFAKFERQNDRHLESYGLLSTAFNRFEDQGVEAGVDLGRYFYLKGSITAGNPLFIRDSNALAGDNGTPAAMAGMGTLNSGWPILYDAEVEQGDWESDSLEQGGAIGTRWTSADGSFAVNGMIFGYQRDMQESVDMHGTLYGGDLDILNAPSLDGAPGTEPTTVLGVEGNEKTEWGGNIWIYLHDLTLFAQYVDQEAAGLGREGYEVEMSYRFLLPALVSIGGEQIFQSIAPALRYSAIRHDFGGPGFYPAPSIWWDWNKTDVGARVKISNELSLTAEYAFHDIQLRDGNESLDEFLATLVWARDI